MRLNAAHPISAELTGYILIALSAGHCEILEFTSDLPDNNRLRSIAASRRGRSAAPVGVSALSGLFSCGHKEFSERFPFPKRQRRETRTNALLRRSFPEDSRSGLVHLFACLAWPVVADDVVGERVG